MAKKKKSANNNPRDAILGNGIYAVKGSKNRRPKDSATSELKRSSSTSAAISKAKKMASIEAYAKENGVTIAQAMIHFM